MACSFFLRWMRRVYRVLLYTYPAAFRRRYGREMEQVFRDRSGDVAQTAGLRGLVRLGLHAGADWAVTTVHERLSSTNVPAQLSGAPVRALDAVPVFYMCDSYSPRSGALMNGGVLTLALFAAVVFVLGHSSQGRRFLRVGSHHPSRSHLLPAQTKAEPTDLEAEVKVRSYPDEIPISPYFRLILVLGALDANHDNAVSSSEIANADRSLRQLDKNRDGVLTAEECGLRLPDSRKSDVQFLNEARLAFMRVHPVLATLDIDHDGRISKSEIELAPRALVTLDIDEDGILTDVEVRPKPLPLRRSLLKTR